MEHGIDFQVETFDHVDRLKQLAELLDEVQVKEAAVIPAPDGEGIWITGAHPSWVSCIAVQFDPAFFEMVCDTPDTGCIGFRVEDLLMAMEYVEPQEEQVMLQCTDEEMQVVTTNGGTQGCFDIRTNHFCEDDIIDEESFEDLDGFTAEAVVDAEAFLRMVDAMPDGFAIDIGDEGVELEQDDDAGTMGSDEDDRYRQFLVETAAAECLHSTDGAARSCFNKEYVNALMPVANTFRLQLGTEYPVLIAAETDLYTVRYFVAPRIAEEKKDEV